MFQEWKSHCGSTSVVQHSRTDPSSTQTRPIWQILAGSVLAVSTSMATKDLIFSAVELFAAADLQDDDNHLCVIG
jgi:hypothetical protein